MGIQQKNEENFFLDQNVHTLYTPKHTKQKTNYSVFGREKQILTLTNESVLIFFFQRAKKKGREKTLQFYIVCEECTLYSIQVYS